MCLFYYYKSLWVFGGGFNEILHSIEKFGGWYLNKSRSNMFADCINYCNLIDTSFKGSKYIWTNKRRYGFYILECLYRLFANYDVTLFIESTVRHLPRTHSNHTPLLLTLQPTRRNNFNIFRFETIWTSQHDSIQILCNSWHPAPSLLEAIEYFQ